jgi:hypothetical protein
MEIIPSYRHILTYYGLGLKYQKQIVDDYILLNGVLVNDNNLTNYLATFRSCILGDTTIEGSSNLVLG